jgi:gliding motility-associated-like protein
VVSIVADPTIIVGTGITIPVTYSPNIATYLWTPSKALSCTDCPNPFANPKMTTKYNIKVTDIYGCEASRDVTVIVVCDGRNYFIPNTFSPNGDGVNDIFGPRGKGIARINDMQIFNRWGQLVFEKKNFVANDGTSAGGWDGTFKGKPAPADVYVYTIEFVCENGAIIPYTGNVALIR